MIKLSFKLPRTLGVAVSGGLDSMAALDFLRRSHEVVALNFHHGTEYSNQATGLVMDYCKSMKIDFLCRQIDEPCPKGESLENFWRQQRYNFFELFNDQFPIVTCHHLDDVVETWLFTSLNGNPNIIPSKRDNYLRPFLQTRKADFEEWCLKKEVPYLNDPSNKDDKFMRNYIRNHLIPSALKVNPGIHKVMKKKVREGLKNCL